MYQNNTRYDIVLRSDLTDEQKALAYKAMGYVLIAYSRKHCVNADSLLKLNKLELVESAKPASVMY